MPSKTEPFLQVLQMGFIYCTEIDDQQGIRDICHDLEAIANSTSELAPDAAIILATMNDS
jgi:hypothetical protein